MRAVDGTLEGAASSEATATPTAATLPAKPAGLTAAAGDAQVVLSWTDPSNSSISEYEYQQRAGGGSWGGWTDFTSGAGTTTHTVTGLANGTDYDFRIRAVNSSGAGPASDAASATPLDANAPARFTVTALQISNQVTLFGARPAAPSPGSSSARGRVRRAPSSGARGRTLETSEGAM